MSRLTFFFVLFVQCYAEVVVTNDCRASLALDAVSCPPGVSDACDIDELLTIELSRDDYQFLEFHAGNIDLLNKYALSSFDTNKLFARLDDTNTNPITSFGLVKGVSTERSGFWAICPTTGTFDSTGLAEEQITTGCYWSAGKPSQKGLPSVIDFVNTTDDVMTTASVGCEGGKSFIVAWLKRRVIPRIITYSSYLTAIGA